MTVASYLANKPAGATLVYLIVAVVLFALAIAAAALTATGRANGTAVAAWRALIAGGLGALVLAFLT